MAAEMSAKIKVEGLAEFKSAMSQAAASVRQSSAEEKKAEAQYRATGDAATYQQQKTEALTKKLDAQEKAVESARKACAALEKAGVAPDDKRLMEWKTKLANAETAVIKTRDELTKLNGTSTAGITKGLGSVEGKAKDAGTELAGIAGKLDRDTIIKGLDAVTDKMEAVMQRAAQMGKAIWDASTDAANWADGIRDSAAAAGMTTTEYQQMAYAAKFFGLSIDDLTSKQSRLTKAMDEGGQIMVGDWAIDTIDRVTGQKRSFNNVMTDIVDGLGQITDPVARDQAAMELFGKSYRDLNQLIEDGGQGWQEKINEAPVVKEETVNSLADTADALKTMDARLEALKMETLAALAPSIETIADAVGDLAQNLTDFLQTKEGQQLLKDLGSAIEGIVNAIVGQDFSGLVNTAKGAIEGLTGALSWLADNKDLVMGAVSGIAFAFLGLKGASAGIQAAETVASFRRLLGIGGGSGSGAAAGAPAGIGGVNAGSGIGSLLGPMAALVLSEKIFLDGATAQFNENMETAEAIHQIQESTMATAQETADAAEAAGKAIDPVADSTRQMLLGKGLSALEYINDPNAQAAPGIGMYVPRTVVNERGLLETIRTMQGQNSTIMQGLLSPETYAALMGAKTDGFLGIGNIGGQQAWDLVNQITQELASSVPEMEQAGSDISSGVSAGIQASAPEAIAAAQAMANAIKATVQSVLDIHSPSKVMASFGAFTGMGLAEGIERSISQVQAASVRMARAAEAPVQSAAGNIYNGGNSTINHYFSVGTYNQNSDSDMDALARRVAGVQRGARQAYGRRK